MDELVTYRLDGTIATIAMDDGKANAMSPRMLAQLGAALDEAERARAVVVLRGREGIFSAGFDLTVLKAGGEAARAMVQGGFSLAVRLLSFPTPIVVACSGHALAMGAFLLLAADYRIGTAGAFKIGANEAAIGLTIPQVAAEICRQRLAAPYFHRAVALAEIFPPELAMQAGFFDRVVASAALSDAVSATAKQLAQLDMPAHLACKLRAQAPTLRAIRAAMEADFAASA